MAARCCSIAAAQLAQFFLWNPTYTTIGYERQAYAFIAGELGDKSQSDELKGLKLDEYPQLMKSVKLIKSITPNPTF